jgi:peptidyl-prolyl cis-trans isomerase SurA
MRTLLLFCLLPLAVRAEVKDRIAAVVNGQPITLSEVEERLGPELTHVPPGPAGAAQRKELLKRGLTQFIDEKLVESEASAMGFDVPEDEVDRAVEQLARQNGMDLPQFREALGQQSIAFETVKDSLRRQQLMYKLLQYKVKPRKVSDEEVQSAYANMSQEADVEVRARHIYISAPDGALPVAQQKGKAKADEALRRLRAGDGFAKVARDLSEGPSAKEGGDLGYFKRGQMVPAIEQAAFSLKPGEVSGLIHTPGERGGYHLVMVEDRRTLPPKPLSEVQEQIRNRLANESVLKEREHYLQQLRKTAHVDEKL